MTFDPKQYGPVVADALATPKLMPLDAGTPRRNGHRTLSDIEAYRLFPDAEISDEMALKACMAALWLYQDELDRAHALGQEVETPEGNYWHGIMHRREGDFTNAKYWFRRVDEHPIHEMLAREAKVLARDVADPRGAPLRIQNAWDPFAFVDLCAIAVQEGGEIAEACRRIQQREWELLFDYCFRKAVGQV